MASPDVTVNPEKVDTNIIIVKLNDKKIKSPEFYDMLLKVNQTSVNSKIIGGWEKHKKSGYIYFYGFEEI